MWTKEKQSIYMKKYVIENKDRLKQLQTEYYAKNRQKRIENSQKWVALNKERAKETRKIYRNTKQGKLKQYINSAKSRNIEFNLTEEEVFNILDENCFYCGQEKSNGIDRIDSNLGYYKENCVPCCSICNYMKQSFSQLDFISQCKKISSHIK